MRGRKGAEKQSGRRGPETGLRPQHQSSFPSFPTSQTLRRGESQAKVGRKGKGGSPPPTTTWPRAQAWVPSMPRGCLGPEEGGEESGEARILKILQTRASLPHPASLSPKGKLRLRRFRTGSRSLPQAWVHFPWVHRLPLGKWVGTGLPPDRAWVPSPPFCRP